MSSGARFIQDAYSPGVVMLRKMQILTQLQLRIRIPPGAPLNKPSSAAACDGIVDSQSVVYRYVLSSPDPDAPPSLLSGLSDVILHSTLLDRFYMVFDLTIVTMVFHARDFTLIL